VGEAYRGSSIRIPRPVVIKGYGFIGDRRLGANSDPYTVAALIISTVCVYISTFNTIFRNYCTILLDLYLETQKIPFDLFMKSEANINCVSRQIQLRVIFIFEFYHFVVARSVLSL
jgi:hypothetical protein